VASAAAPSKPPNGNPTMSGRGHFARGKQDGQRSRSAASGPCVALAPLREGGAARWKESPWQVLAEWMTGRQGEYCGLPVQELSWPPAACTHPPTRPSANPAPPPMQHAVLPPPRLPPAILGRSAVPPFVARHPPLGGGLCFALPFHKTKASNALLAKSLPVRMRRGSARLAEKPAGGDWTERSSCPPPRGGCRSVERKSLAGACGVDDRAAGGVLRVACAGAFAISCGVHPRPCTRLSTNPDPLPIQGAIPPLRAFLPFSLDVPLPTHSQRASMPRNQGFPGILGQSPPAQAPVRGWRPPSVPPLSSPGRFRGS
jgi:hypothetical protein